MPEILLLICIILICILLFKKHKYIKIDNKTKEENEKLLNYKESIINEINFLNKEKDKNKKDLEEIQNITKNMNAAARESFTEYCESLEREYNHIEEEHDESVELLAESYGNLQQKYIDDIEKVKSDLAKISQTRAAAIEAQLKEQEIKDKQSFYCPQVPEMELKDAKTLRDIEYKLNNPRILRMLIWSTFYQKPMNQVCANVLGAATAEKCGIYKITNQKTNLCYIGQAVDIATR